MLKQKTIFVSFVSLSVFILTGILALFIGSVSISPRTIIGILLGYEEISATAEMIILSVRLPRILLAGCIGAGLSLAGVILQALLRNPLAEPYILGISSGAAVGAISAITLGIGVSLLHLSLPAFAGAILTMALVYMISQRHGHIQSDVLILTGVIVGFFFSSLIVLLMYFSGDSLQKITFWLMGDLSNANYEQLWLLFPILSIGFVITFLNSRAFNLITAGEETATLLGLNVEWTKRIAYFTASVLTGAAVSISGIIGFVGLIVPHMLRLIVGFDHRVLIPASFFVGAAFLIGIDTIARTVISPTELPVGVVTALTGGPFFVYLLRKRYGTRWH